MPSNADIPSVKEIPTIPFRTKKGWILFALWGVLFLLSFIPWPWYYSPEPLIGGWLPFPLFYWWVVEVMYILFISYITYRWLQGTKAARMRQATRETSGNDDMEEDI